MGYHRLDPRGARSEASSIPWPDGTLIVMVLAVELLLFDLFLYCVLRPGGELSFLFQEPRALGLSFLEIRAAVNVLMWVFALSWLLIGGIRNRGPRSARWAAYALAFAVLGGQQVITASWEDTCDWARMAGRRELGRIYWGYERQPERHMPPGGLMMPVTPLIEPWERAPQGAPCILVARDDGTIWSGDRECVVFADEHADLESLRDHLQRALAEAGSRLAVVLQADMNAPYLSLERVLRTCRQLPAGPDQVLLTATGSGERWDEHLGFVRLRLHDPTPGDVAEAVSVRVVKPGTKYTPDCTMSWSARTSFRLGWDRELGYSFCDDAELSLGELAAAVDEALRGGGSIRLETGPGVALHDMLRLFESLPSWQPSGILLGVGQ